MPNRGSFKADASFLEKISMGAIGTMAVVEDLEKQGHSPIELERGSTSFKIWKSIKIKRIRVPDILCLSCGKSVECRTKTKLEISMSHSRSDPERGWDYGLDGDDCVAFVVCKKGSQGPIDWKPTGGVQYVFIKDLRAAEKAGLAVITKPKGAEEGFEMRVIWPVTTASAPGIVESVTEDRIQYRRKADGRVITLRLSKKGKPLRPLVSDKESIQEYQILASVVPSALSFPCDGSACEQDYLRLLSSPSLARRYTGAKALGFFPSTGATEALAKKLRDTKDHIYIRLEAAAGLARQDEQAGYEFVAHCLGDKYLQNRLEAVIVLGELPKDKSCRLLVEVLLDKSQHPEIRAGAAWALGELRNRLALDALIESFAAVENDIRAEACRALAKLGQRYTPDIIREFPRADTTIRPGISWALSKAGTFRVRDLLDTLVDEDARHWVAYIVGTQDQQKYIQDIEQLHNKDSEVYFAVTVLWKIMTSWIWHLEEY